MLAFPITASAQADTLALETVAVAEVATEVLMGEPVRSNFSCTGRAEARR